MARTEAGSVEGRVCILGLRELPFPTPNPEPLSDRRERTYGDKGQWTLGLPWDVWAQGPRHISVRAKSQGHPHCKERAGERGPHPVLWSGFSPSCATPPLLLIPRLESRKGDLCHLWLQGLLLCQVCCPWAAPPERLAAEDPPVELASLSTLPTSNCSPFIRRSPCFIVPQFLL